MMSDREQPVSRVPAVEARAPAYIGPLIAPNRWPLRYGAAAVVVFAVLALRMALAPLLGAQAPLLPFVLAVVVSVYLGGRGAGLLATVLTPLATTFWFATWQSDAQAGQWVAHVLFFMLIALLTVALMHELQRASLAQLAALRATEASEAQASKSASQLRLITDAMPALISYIDTDHVYRFTNKLYETWFGKSSEQLAGRPVREVLGPEAYKVVGPRLERAMQGTRVFYETEIPYESGAREVAVHYIPDMDPQGAVRGCFALIEDVSHRKRAERVLREADRRKDEFLAILAHELRNPLAPIRTMAHVLSHGTADAETVQRAGVMLERQSRQLTRLVDDLLDVARIIRGRVTLHREPVKLASVVETAVDSLRSALEARHQEVHVSGADTDLWVDGDRVRLCQVISNLVSNAIKYSQEGAAIELELRPVGGSAELIVRDSGIGIEPQMLPHVFDRYLQGDHSMDRADGGLGLGLTIVRHLVELHGGRVLARSAGPGRGSAFHVYLPCIGAARDGPSDERPREALRTVRRRVLVIDDNRDAANSMRELLRTNGHEVEVAHDGGEALGKLDSFPADVVLLDIALPHMDGFMVAHAIRARYSLRQLRPRLIALTGYARPEDRDSALRSGFDGHLGKPVDPALLLRMIADEGQRQVAVSHSG